MDRLFVSFSSEDLQYAIELREKLEVLHFDPWIYRDGVKSGENFRGPVRESIESAVAVIAVITPDFALSGECRTEIDIALENKKKIVPIYIKETNKSLLHTKIRDLNWIDRKDYATEEEFYSTIVQSVNEDIDWERTKERLNVKALEWRRKKRDKGRLLRGSSLREGKKTLADHKGREQGLTDIQLDFINESIKSGLRRRTFLTIASFVFVLMGIIALFLWSLSEERSLRAELEKFQREEATSNTLSTLAVQARSELSYWRTIAYVDEALKTAQNSKVHALAAMVPQPVLIPSSNHSDEGQKIKLFSLHPTKQVLIVVNENDEFFTYDYNENTFSKIAFPEGRSVHSISFNKDNSIMAVGNNKKSGWERVGRNRNVAVAITLLEMDTWRLISDHKTINTTAKVTQTVFSENGTLIGLTNGTVYHWPNASEIEDSSLRIESSGGRTINSKSSGSDFFKILPSYIEKFDSSGGKLMSSQSLEELSNTSDHLQNSLYGSTATISEKYLLVGTGKGEVFRFDVSNLIVERALGPHQRQIRSICMSPDGSLAIVSWWDNSLAVVSMDDFVVIESGKNLTAKPKQLLISGNSKILFVLDEKGTISQWRINVNDLSDPELPVNVPLSRKYSEDFLTFSTSSAALDELPSFPANEYLMRVWESISFLSKAQRKVISDDKEYSTTVLIQRYRSGRLKEKELIFPHGPVVIHDVHSKNKWILIATKTSISVYDWGREEVIFSDSFDMALYIPSGFVQQSNIVYVARHGQPGTDSIGQEERRKEMPAVLELIEIHDNGEPSRQSVELKAGSIPSNVSLDPSSRWIAVATEMGTFICDLKDNSFEDVRFGGITGVPLAADFSPDGRYLAATEYGSVFIIRPGSWRIMRQIDAHNAMIRSVEFSPCGRMLLTIANDNSMRIYNPDSGELIASHSFVGKSRVNNLSRSFSVFNPDLTIEHLYLSTWADIFPLSSSFTKQITRNSTASEQEEVTPLRSFISKHLQRNLDKNDAFFDSGSAELWAIVKELRAAIPDNSVKDPEQVKSYVKELDQWLKSFGENRYAEYAQRLKRQLEIRQNIVF